VKKGGEKRMVSDYKKAKVLIVDDSSFSRGLIQKTLHELGIANPQIEQAGSGEEAIDKMKETKFELFVLDIVMSGIDGIAVLREVRKTQPAAKVIMCSGSNANEMVDELIELGIDAFISKPFKATIFKNAFYRAFGIAKEEGMPDYWLAKCHKCDRQMIEVNSIHTIDFVCPNRCMKIGPLPAALIRQEELDDDYEKAKGQK
jgi:two-component system, chemotaxis family, chemotaxis protein CheY